MADNNNSMMPYSGGTSEPGMLGSTWKFMNENSGALGLTLALFTNPVVSNFASNTVGGLWAGLTGDSEWEAKEMSTTRPSKKEMKSMMKEQLKMKMEMEMKFKKKMMKEEMKKGAKALKKKEKKLMKKVGDATGRSGTEVELEMMNRLLPALQQILQSQQPAPAPVPAPRYEAPRPPPPVDTRRLDNIEQGLARLTRMFEGAMARQNAQVEPEAPAPVQQPPVRGPVGEKPQHKRRDQEKQQTA